MTSKQLIRLKRRPKLISEIREVLSVVGTTDIALVSNESKLTDQFKELIIKLTKKLVIIEQAEESDGLRLKQQY